MRVTVALLGLAWCAPLSVSGVATAPEGSHDWTSVNMAVAPGYPDAQPDADALAIMAAEEKYLADRADAQAIADAEDHARALSGSTTRDADQAIFNDAWHTMEKASLRLRAAGCLGDGSQPHTT